MSLEYIRKFYGVPATRGAKVKIEESPSCFIKGTIVGSRDAYVLVRLDGHKKSRSFHPTWNIEYLGEPINEKTN